MMEFVMFVVPLALWLMQTILLLQTQRHLRAANARTDRAMAIADEWKQVAARFEAINETNFETIQSYRKALNGAA